MSLVSRISSPSNMNFTPSQQAAFDSYLNQENIFITGPGGCGKSYFIQQVYKHAKENGKNIRITSMTGCSAILLNCGATTIHKWGCLGLGKGEEFDMYKKILKMKRHGNYIDTDILVLDEVSMLNEKLFEVLDYLCKSFRKVRDKPFGGLQLICSGDFYQLPPVCTDRTVSAESNFCFESALWNETFHNSYLFDVNFRQHEDPRYFDMLQEIRKGQVSFDTVAQLIECSKKTLDPEDPIKPTKIFPIKKTVDSINQSELNKRTEKKYPYHCKFYHNNTLLPTLKHCPEKAIQTEMDYMVKNSMFEEELSICVGCQVMCICNLDQEKNLVNGSQGVVLEFQYNAEKNNYYPLVKFDKVDEPVLIQEHPWLVESNAKFSIHQLPLVLSWAITTHKSQGLSIEKALIDIGNNIFEFGQTYVALSRVKSLEGLYLTKVNAQKIKAHPKVIAFYKQFQKEINT